PGGNKLAVLDQILAKAKVVAGDAVDTSLEVGREFILRHWSKTSLMATLVHEFGHHVTNALMGRGEQPESETDRLEALREVTRALPGLVKAGAAAAGQPFKDNDPRT